MSNYIIPAIYVRATTAALIVGTLNVAMLPASGANLAYRIVGGRVILTRGAGAGAIVDITLRESGAPPDFLGATLTQGQKHTHEWHIPEPGYILTPNRQVQYLVASTVAGGNVHIDLYYYIDQV